MSRLERITITNDARVPRVAAFPNGVTWYAYIRESNSGLYLQREFGGVRGAEILVVNPVNRVEVIHDPDGGKAYLYFINDECLLRIEVTDALENPTLQAYTRSATWYDAAFSGFGAGADASVSSPRIDPPSIALLPHPSLASLRTLIIARPNIALVRNARLAGYLVYKNEDPAGQGYVLHATLPYNGQPIQNLVVPATLTPLTSWYVTSFKVRAGFLESLPSNIESDNGNVRGNTVGATFGAGVDAGWSLVTKTPVKRAPLPDLAPATFGAGVDVDWSRVTKTPVKRSRGPDTTAAAFGAGVDVSWVLNGTEIINP